MQQIKCKMKDFWQKLPNKGQPPNSGHWSMYQLALYSEVPLYMRVLYTVLFLLCSSSVALSGLVIIGMLHRCVGVVGDFPTGNS